MKFAPVAVENKKGKNIMIRTAVPTDAPALRWLKLSYIKDCDTIPLFEDEYANNDEQEAIMIQRYLDEANSLLLVAEHDGRLIGNLDLTGNQRRKLYHTGMIGMGIHNDWHNTGVGTILLNSCVAWAKNNPLLNILWLEVYSTNAGGRRLYEKSGFKTCGEIKNFFSNASKITMVQYV